MDSQVPDSDGAARFDPRKVAVIIPAFNAAEVLPEALAALEEQELSPAEGWRVVVVDNNSTDGTGAWAEDYQRRMEARFPGWVTVVREERAGAAAARNAGARAARKDAEILVFLDADCRPLANWLREILGALTKRAAGAVLFDAVGGLLHWLRPLHELPLMERYAEHQGILHVERFYEPGPCKPPFVLSANMAVRRDWFDRLGGFDEGLRVGEDADFCWRLQREGGRLGLARQAIAVHRHRTSLRSFARQMFNYGVGSAQLFSRHRELMGCRAHFDGGAYMNILRALGQTVVFPVTKGSPYLKVLGPLELVRHTSFLAGRYVGAIRYRVLVF